MVIFTFAEIFSVKNTTKRILQSILGFDRYLSIFARYKVYTLKFDKKESDFFTFLKMVPDEGIILDIGANLGIMTWHLLRHFKKARIWAFEPIPDNLKVLKRMLKTKSKERYKLFEMALGSERGQINMVLPEVENVRMQGLSHVVHDSIDDFNEGRQYKVKMDTLDNLVPRTEVVSGIKLDVENFEYFVLKGGQNLLERDHPVIYTELWENENRYKCFEFLGSLGYSAKVCREGAIVDFNKEHFTGQNFFFVYKG